MVGWSRRNRHIKSKPCPCNNICLCHNPQKEHWPIYAVMIAALLIFFGMPIILTYYNDAHQVSIRHIEVNGQMCEIHFKETGRTSTGTSFGHEIAICK